ncbi:hypothetical protein J3459_015866 [Metarhizium acridum]|nr:hypothetical protein J3459_015866 [Metarhizium acridum]
MRARTPSFVDSAGYRLRQQRQQQPPPNGDVIIDSFQLYPESADFKQGNGKNLHENRIEDIITFDRTLQPEFHASGVEVDPKQNQLSVAINAGIAFDTQGENVTGDNFLYKVALSGKPETLWKINLNDVTREPTRVARIWPHDNCGNTFVVCTYPGAIVKVNSNGQEAKLWYQSNYNQACGDLFIVNDAQANKLVSFKKRDGEGKRVEIPVSGLTGETGDDGVYLPEKYGGKVLLTQLSGKGTNVKYISKQGFAVATVQIKERIYGVIEYFMDAANKVPGTVAGNRTQFELEDLTTQIDELVKGKI